VANTLISLSLLRRRKRYTALEDLMQTIGIFWIFQGRIYSYREKMTDALHQDVDKGHYEYWFTLQNLYPELRDYSYDVVPRGRVLVNDGEVIVYSSQEIIDDEDTRRLILEHFGLNEARFVCDEHYQKIADLGFDTCE